jgi:hypothetical protein
MSEAAYEKVSVTLPRELVASARRRAGAGGFSAYIAEGLRRAEHMADLDEFLRDRESQHGPIPDAIMQEVREAWPDPHVDAPNPRSKPHTRSSSTPKA